MSHLQRVTTPPPERLLRQELEVKPMKIKGTTWTGWRPIDESDNRYFERAISPSGVVEWYELTPG